MFTDSLSGDFLPSPAGAMGACERDRAGTRLAELCSEGSRWRRGWLALRQAFGGLSAAAGRPGLGDCSGPPIGAQCGALLYQLARLGDVRLAVVLGAGDAAATIWLACALRANHRHRGDRAIIACEPAHALARSARCELLAAGVSRYVDLRKAGPSRCWSGSISRWIVCCSTAIRR